MKPTKVQTGDSKKINQTQKPIHARVPNKNPNTKMFTIKRAKPKPNGIEVLPLYDALRINISSNHIKHEIRTYDSLCVGRQSFCLQSLDQQNTDIQNYVKRALKLFRSDLFERNVRLVNHGNHQSNERLQSQWISYCHYAGFFVIYSYQNDSMKY